MSGRFALVLTAVLASAACSTAPGSTTPPSTDASPAPGTAASVAASAPLMTLNPATPASSASASAGGTPPLATAAPTDTTFTLVLGDGPREGTWTVTQPGGAVATCQYLPDLERWLATWFGPGPLLFVDVRGEQEDPSIFFKFSAEGSELSLRSVGDVTFDADDRGDTATLTWLSERNEGAYYDASGNNMGDEEMGRAELTIECGSIFRHST